MPLTIRYITGNDTLQSDATVTKIETVKNGSSLLVTNATTSYVVPVRNFIEVY